MRRLLTVSLTAVALLATTLATAPVAASTPGASTPSRPAGDHHPTPHRDKHGNPLEPTRHGGIHGLKRRVATPHGITQLAATREVRSAVYADVLADWTVADRETLGALLHRLNVDLDRYARRR